MESKPEKIVHNGALIDFVHDELLDTHHAIFNSGLDKCSQSNMISKEDKDFFLSDEHIEITIIETPGDPITALLAVVALVSIAVAAYVYFNMPTPDTGNLQQGSNNSLRGRTNRERPLERIEDIAGQVRSYPTLIQQVYKKFNSDLQEVEYSLMCVSKGEGLIEQVKDSDTPLEIIKGTGASFYSPFKMASVDAPFLTVGDSFVEPVKIVTRSNEVAGGQVIDFDSKGIYYRNCEFSLEMSEDETPVQTGNGSIRTIFGPEFNFEIGELIQIISDQGPNAIRGIYEVVDIFEHDFLGSIVKTMIVKNPDGGHVLDIDSNWTESEQTFKCSILRNDFEGIIGPFYLSQKDRTEYFANVVANGLQKDGGGQITVQFATQYAQADENGNQIGPWSDQEIYVLTGNTKDRIGLTMNVTTDFIGPCLVRFVRRTGRIGDAILQDVKLDSLYSVEPITVSDFGDVTTVQVRTLANSQASNLKERKFNCIFTRKLQMLQDDGTLGAFEPTRRFIDYFMYATLDDSIGRRDASEVNAIEIYEKSEEINSYMGSDEASLFDYTFDNDQLSFQQILSTMGNACFFRPVRRAGVITIRLDKPEEARTIFTHRNKIPNQQTITRTFESEGQKDGIEFEYIDPDTNSVATLSIPPGVQLRRPEKYRSVGVRNHNKAWWLAWRRYNLLRNRRINLTDNFTSDGALLSVGDVVAITNNTKGNPMSGDILAQQGLLLKLSQFVEFDDEDATYSIAIRMRDGSIDVIPCDPGPRVDEVILSRVPRDELYLGYTEEKNTFIFSKDETLSAEKYIIQSVNRQNMNDIPITAYNYSDALYANDGESSPRN